MLRRADEAEARAAIARNIGDEFAPRRWLVDALKDALQRGVELWLVSASPRLAVETGAARIGLLASEAIGIELAAGGYLAPWPIDTGKPAACRARGRTPPAVALGDTQWDLPLLQWAQQGYMLNRATEDPQLFTSAAALRP